MAEPSPTAALRARAEAVLWIRTQMARHGLTHADLVAAGCFEQAAQAAPPSAMRYRSADGKSWDGKGEMPDWLRRAANAGQSVEHFLIGG
ncbi:H-NS family nucleoid-associated regulatory protein [Cupriavidus basilensis]|uniref:H-NS family nucleoid-associated regulatory protein n=2 Tax=Cupriavidus basilensis TaxID=68895 RepID=A0ABT6ATN5_9BURK|nr:H-NS family nucleoid-associated regulatory protein [Cupriavidus basilensis]MDF3835982.1 H-NS family nucleoid-associated regulatory protein [Cupriavidus basilensis]